jgi:NarL family two-component system response regulator LiaR
MALDMAEFERMRTNLRALDARRGQFEHALALFRARRSHLAPVTAPADADESPVHLALTARECEILRLIAKGLDNTEIAHELHFALGTIKMHVRDILAKLDATSRTEAAVRAVRLRVI